MKLGLVFGLIVVTGFIQIITGATAEVEANTIEAQNLRLRVIAHSDDETDQLIKRLTVFAATDFMNQHIQGHTADFLTQNLENLHDNIAKVLTEIGADVQIEISLGHHYFPVSNTYHESLVIRLGEAKGENWWCFINPGVCVVPTDDYTSSNSAQVEVRTEIQESFGTRSINFIGNLFNVGQRQELAEGEIDWFLFDDER